MCRVYAVSSINFCEILPLGIAKIADGTAVIILISPLFSSFSSPFKLQALAKCPLWLPLKHFSIPSLAIFFHQGFSCSILARCAHIFHGEQTYEAHFSAASQTFASARPLVLSSAACAPPTWLLLTRMGGSSPSPPLLRLQARFSILTTTLEFVRLLIRHVQKLVVHQPVPRVYLSFEQHAHLSACRWLESR